KERVMRKCLIAMIMTVILAVSLADPPQSTNAGAFATEYTQLLNHAQLLLQYIRQAEQLAEAIKQTTDMIKNSRTLSSQVFGPITSDLNALASIVRGGMALSYSLANVDAIFRERFPGYGYGGTAYYLNYKNWSQTTLDTTLGALRAAGLQGKQLDDEQAVLNSVRAMAQSTDGRLGAQHCRGRLQRVRPSGPMGAGREQSGRSERATHSAPAPRRSLESHTAEASVRCCDGVLVPIGVPRTISRNGRAARGSSGSAVD